MRTFLLIIWSPFVWGQVSFAATPLVTGPDATEEAQKQQPQTTAASSSYQKLKSKCEQEGCAIGEITIPDAQTLYGFHTFNNQTNRLNNAHTPLKGKVLFEFPKEYAVYDEANNVDYKATTERLLVLRKTGKLPADQQPSYNKANKQWYFPVRVWAADGKYLDKPQTGIMAVSSLPKSTKRFKGVSQNESPKPSQAQVTPAVIPVVTAQVRPKASKSSAGNLTRAPRLATGDAAASSPSEEHSELTSPSPVAAQNSQAPMVQEQIIPLAQNPLLDECPMSNIFFKSIGGAKGLEYCWKGLSEDQIVQKIFDYVNAINALRPQFYLDPRYSTCIAYKESAFIPNIETPDPISTARGLFQVTRTTHRGIDRTVGRSSLPGYSHLSSEEYRTQMVRSPLAQTDVHHRVAQEKFYMAMENGRIPRGTNPRLKNQSQEYWKAISLYYYGNWDYPLDHRHYVDTVNNCQVCMNGMYDQDGRKKSNGSPLKCLEETEKKRPKGTFAWNFKEGLDEKLVLRRHFLFVSRVHLV